MTMLACLDKFFLLEIWTTSHSESVAWKACEPNFGKSREGNHCEVHSRQFQLICGPIISNQPRLC